MRRRPPRSTRTDTFFPYTTLFRAVRIVQAEGDEKKYGNQDTDGSRSLRHHIQPARDIGAAVRRMLEQAAAERWQTEVANVEAVNHEVVHKSLGLRLGYGALAEAAMALPVPARSDLTFKDEKAFRYIGKGQVQIVDLHDIDRKSPRLNSSH